MYKLEAVWFSPEDGSGSCLIRLPNRGLRYLYDPFDQGQLEKEGMATGEEELKSAIEKDGYRATKGVDFQFESLAQAVEAVRAMQAKQRSRQPPERLSDILETKAG